MKASWVKEIKQAQDQKTYMINGQEFARIPYGNEAQNWGAEIDGNRVYIKAGTYTLIDASNPCHDCLVEKGQFHVPGCDVERCPSCKGQNIACSCSDDEEEEE